jgi:hypothetical protein
MERRALSIRRVDWAVAVRVLLQVLLAALRQPFRTARTYEGFGPFTFERDQYVAAVAEAITALRDDGR